MAMPVEPPAWHELAMDHLPYALKVARAYAKRLPVWADRLLMEEAAVEELVRTAQEFDASKGVPYRAWLLRRVRFACVDTTRRQLGRRGRRMVEAPCGHEDGFFEGIPDGQSVSHGVGYDLEVQESVDHSLRELGRRRGGANLARVMRLIYVDGHEQKVVAKKLGVSKARVSQIHKRSLLRLREILSVA